MKRPITDSAVAPHVPVGKAWDEVSASFDRFCLAAGLEALGTMMERDAEEACGPRHGRGSGRRGHRWGRTQGKIGFHAGKVDVERPRVRDLAGKALALPSWQQAVEEDWLGKWAMNLMLINVSTRKIPSGGAASGRRHPGAFGSRRVEVGGVTALRGVVGGPHEGMDGRGSFHPRHHGGAD